MKFCPKIWLFGIQRRTYLCFTCEFLPCLQTQLPQHRVAELGQTAGITALDRFWRKSSRFGTAPFTSNKMGSATQQYCLRWNNHRSNLLAVFDELLRNEAFTDVTLACEGGTSVKCHKMVLAACSSYFQSLFTELPCRHPVVVLKDVKYSEMKAILEYMYRGEVNVAQDQLAALLKVAEALKVKGLVEERGPLSHTIPSKDPAEQHQHPHHQHQHQHQLERHREDDPSSAHSPPSISTSTANVSPLPHSSSNISPPHSSGMPGPPFEKNPYNLYGKSPVMERGSGRMSLPMWAMPGLPLPHHPSPVPAPSHPHTAAAAMLNSCYEAAGAADMSPLKRKKLQGLLMSRDTPILRTVLGQGQQGQQGSQGQADSSQPMSLVCQPDSHIERNHSNGSAHDIDKVRSILSTPRQCKCWALLSLSWLLIGWLCGSHGVCLYSLNEQVKHQSLHLKVWLLACRTYYNSLTYSSVSLWALLSDMALNLRLGLLWSVWQYCPNELWKCVRAVPLK